MSARYIACPNHGDHPRCEVCHCYVHDGPRPCNQCYNNGLIASAVKTGLFFLAIWMFGPPLIQMIKWLF